MTDLQARIDARMDAWLDAEVDRDLPASAFAEAVRYDYRDALKGMTAYHAERFRVTLDEGIVRPFRDALKAARR